MDAVSNFLSKTGIALLFSQSNWWQYLVMYVIVGTLFYLAIVKKFEPLLLMPIAFGMLLANLPGAEIMHLDFFFNDYYFSVADGATYSVQFREFLAGLADGVDNPVFAEEFSKFFDALKENNFSEEFRIGEKIGDIEYYLCKIAEDGKITFDFSKDTLAQAGITTSEVSAAFNNAFTAKGYNIGYLVETLESINGVDTPVAYTLHIKMSTMIKEVINYGGLLDFLYLGVKLGIYPSLIFLGVGAMTDFSPLIANPKSLFMGAGAQLGVFVAFAAALLIGFTPMEAGSIGIIGGADGPTAILVTKTLAPHLLGAIAIAAYSYMALIPIIQPPFMKLLTTEKERSIKMTNLRSVSKVEKVIFPIAVTLVVTLIVPDAAPLVGFLMLGNLFNVSGVSDRLSKTAQNELINIVTICLGVSVGATANAENFLKPQTLYIIALGLCAFVISTCGGLVTGKIMCKLSGGKINPLIGSAGVSAVPMAARVAQDVGRKTDPSNFLLMHAMGPNVAGVIGSAVAAGVFLSFFG